MPIKLRTTIQASAAQCCRLSLDAEVHLSSMVHTGERVIAGRASGMFQLGDSVTWQARHFGITRQLEVRVTELSFPTHFRDEMIRGAFKVMRHDHYFIEKEGTTQMTDIFYYEVPFGLAGKIADWLYLRRYMRSLLTRRNAFIKAAAEASCR